MKKKADIPKRNKLHAIKVHDDGYIFDSKLEHRRYCELKLLRDAGEIEDLRVHESFNIEVNGVKICRVELDFTYLDTRTKKWVYEDTKGMDTPVSKLKRKLLLACHGIEVTLIKSTKKQRRRR